MWEVPMKAKLIVVFAGAGLLIWAVPILAHHSFASEYDADKPVELKGVVTKVEWMNPHARFYVDVKDAKDQVTNWNLELASPNVLVRNGWRRTSLQVGDHVTVNGRWPRTDRRWPTRKTWCWPTAARCLPGPRAGTSNSRSLNV